MKNCKDCKDCKHFDQDVEACLAFCERDVDEAYERALHDALRIIAEMLHMHANAYRQ